MTPQEIRRHQIEGKEVFFGPNQSNHAIMLFLREIAAQLAETNEHLAVLRTTKLEDKP